MVTAQPQRYLYRDHPAESAADRRTLIVPVHNTGDRAIRVGSHFHFFEVDPTLAFDRAATFGMRPNIAAGTSIRFEPGATRQVELRPFAGSGRLVGCSELPHGGGGAAQRAARLGATLRAIEHGLREAHARAGRIDSDAPAPAAGAAQPPAGRAGRPAGRPVRNKPGTRPPTKPGSAPGAAGKGPR
ncbi:urease subunit beta [Embleya scabrispora]|uniref:urease subunit beta n=1 Tax=Embleya scabrispora TaxID=159449 RepID=UPI00037F5624|nr:urease subunit beta [Embleya scabrispora]MYS83569.1 urease subunit beta [Streptomyces sp. SID5474]